MVIAKIAGNYLNVKVVKKIYASNACLHVNVVMAKKPCVTSVNHLWNVRGEAAANRTVRIALMERIMMWSIATFANDTFAPTVDTWSLGKLALSALARPASI